MRQERHPGDAMIVRLADLEEGPVEREFRFDGGWVDERLRGTSVRHEGTGGTLRVQVALSGRTVTVTGRLQGRFWVPCSRCLDPAPIGLDGSFRLVLERREKWQTLPEELELGPEDLDLGYYEEDEVDLAPYVAEQLLLAVPMKPLCRQDCWPAWFEGRVHREGEEPAPEVSSGAVDERWAALAALAERMKH